MINRTTMTLETPPHNFGVDAGAYISQMNKKVVRSRRVVLFTGVPIIISTIIAAMVIRPEILVLTMIAACFTFTIYIVYGMGAENALYREYTTEFRAGVSKWATEKLVPYLHEEHGITVLGDNYLSLIWSKGQGMRAKTRDGEIIRFKLDGANFENQEFIDVVSFDPEGLRIMTLQKELAV